MKKFTLVALLLASCANCPPGTAANYEAVKQITEENNAVIEASTDPESVKNPLRTRNREALETARKLAEYCK